MMVCRIASYFARFPSDPWAGTPLSGRTGQVVLKKRGIAAV